MLQDRGMSVDHIAPQDPSVMTEGGDNQRATIPDGDERLGAITGPPEHEAALNSTAGQYPDYGSTLPGGSGMG